MVGIKPQLFQHTPESSPRVPCQSFIIHIVHCRRNPVHMRPEELEAKYHTSNCRRGDHSESFILNALLGGFSLFVMESAWKWAADHIKDEKGDSAKENTEKPTPKTKSKAKTIATISKDASSSMQSWFRL